MFLFVLDKFGIFHYFLSIYYVEIADISSMCGILSTPCHSMPVGIFTHTDFSNT